MIKKGRHLIKSHMTLEYSFSGIRLQDGTLTPVDWDLKVDLVATGKKNTPKEEIEYNANMTYQKVHFWLDTNLPGVLVVDAGHEEDLYIANLTTNIMLYSPDVTCDSVLIQLLHAKISSLASPDLMVGEMHLKGSDTSLQYTFDCVDGEYTLPSTTKEYYTEGKTKDEIPWWFRNDGFCFEFVHPDELAKTGDNSQTPVADPFSNIVDPLDEFNRIIAEVSQSTQVNLIKEPAKIVQVEKWKPRKVE